MASDELGSHDFEAAIQNLAGQAREALKAAYDAGYAAGRRSMADQLQCRLENVIAEVAGGKVATLQISTRPQPTVIVESANVDAAQPRKHAWSDREKRAERGSVRPVVIEWLSNSNNGGKPFDIAKDTGLNENTIRGMLNTLGKEGLAEKRGELWFKKVSSVSVSEALI